MVRLIITIIVGAVIAAGGTVVVTNVLNSAATGTPSPASIYQYGSR